MNDLENAPVNPSQDIPLEFLPDPKFALGPVRPAHGIAHEPHRVRLADPRRIVPLDGFVIIIIILDELLGPCRLGRILWRNQVKVSVREPEL